LPLRATSGILEFMCRRDALLAPLFVAAFLTAPRFFPLIPTP
jgi:hypothetical protein